jgi:transposase
MLDKKLLKGTRWLLLKNQGTINDNIEAKKRLEEALLINLPLSTEYYLKEELKLIWQQEEKQECQKVFGQ